MSKGFASNYRIILLATVVIGCFCGLGVRLVYLHVIDREELVQVVAKARRQIVPETARRGDILDARGNILATSRSMIVLGVDPQSLRPEDEAKWPLLAPLIKDAALQLDVSDDIVAAMLVVHDGSVRSGSVRSGSVRNGSDHNGSVRNGSVHNGSVDNGSVGSVHNGSVDNGSVDNGSIQNGSVRT